MPRGAMAEVADRATHGSATIAARTGLASTTRSHQQVVAVLDDRGSEGLARRGRWLPVPGAARRE